jgi:hypothetical protein
LNPDLTDVLSKSLEDIEIFKLVEQLKDLESVTNTMQDE